MSDPNRKEYSYSEKPNSSDTISRQAAIDALEKVAKLYPWRVPGDRDSYSQYNEAWQDALNRADSEIEALPSTQPGIIYCKNCIYYRWEIDMCDEPYSTAHNVVHEYDYCSRAERKTDG